MSKSKGEWSWARTEPLHGFQPSETSSYITYMLEITTTKGHNYYLYLGEIFNPKIDKVTFRNDTITAKIKKINNNTFCFAVVDTELVGTDYFNLGAKAYDNLGKIVE